MNRSLYSERLSAIQRALDSADLLLKNQQPETAMTLMSQVAETMGGLLDKKPASAKEQGRKRFETAMKKLLGKKYGMYSTRLYQQWRCFAVHSLMPGNYLVYVEDAALHLTEQEKVLRLSPSQVYKDLQYAYTILEKKFAQAK